MTASHVAADILRVAVPVPLRRSFDYLPPADYTPAQMAALLPGVRVRVSFGRQTVIGVLLEVVHESAVPHDKLKAVLDVLDVVPVLSADVLTLTLWAADYYHCPVGEALATVLPTLLREGNPCAFRQQELCKLTVADPLAVIPASAKKQRELCGVLLARGAVPLSILRDESYTRVQLNALVERGVAEIVCTEQRPLIAVPHADDDLLRERSLRLNSEQFAAFAAIEQQRNFQAFLVEGVTGSGKTEVYLQVIESVLRRGQRALVLVPEIGLTPQLIARFRQRFYCHVAAFHSGMTPRERLDNWLLARDGSAGIVIGTRSALFTSVPQLGVIIVDEEHDASYKQQDGFRYSARDLAIVRAQRDNIPVVLGTATPSLETLHNALAGRYRHLRITQRAGGASSPVLELVNLSAGGEMFSPEVVQAIEQTLCAGQQALVFINRRGYAPVLLCGDCAWVAKCEHCDVRLTVHKRANQLRCHYCGHREMLPAHCPGCHSRRFALLGHATQRVEENLREIFPYAEIMRVDRDSTATKSAFEDIVARINEDRPAILVGTQMLAKGHHFPAVTLVVIQDADAVMFSVDFRGTERAAQLITQVAGRAGRAQHAGRVLVQTRFAQHPFLQWLATVGYHGLALKLLDERRLASLPPHSYFGLIVAESKNPQAAERALRTALRAVPASHANVLEVYGPLPALAEKRAGYFRFQILIKSAQRAAIATTVDAISTQLESQQLRGVRWFVDMDPLEV